MTAIADGSSRSLARSAASQFAGRVTLSLGRLLVAMLIVRGAGVEVFGAYTLVIQYVLLAEWLVDFGQADLAVRDIAREPVGEPVVLEALSRLKLLHGAVFGPLLPLTLLILGYPATVVEAGAVGGVAVLAYAAVQPARVRFRVWMRAERDVAAELAGLAVMLPLTWMACRAELGLVALVGCYAVGRVVQLALAFAFMGDWPGRFAATGCAGTLWRGALPLGFAGLLVMVYDSLATLMLSKLGGMEAVGQYAAATRFVFPVIIAVQALTAAFYPPLSATWRGDPGRFQTLQQAALDLSVLAAGLLLCGVFAAAPFLMGLLGPEIAAAAPVLRVLCLVILARAVTTAMSPLIVVAGQQGRALWLSALAVAVQAAAILLLIPRFGLVGVAAGYLVVEILVSVVPIAVIGQHVASVRLRWSVPLRMMACALFAAMAAEALPFAGTFAAGVVAACGFLFLVVVTRTVSVAQLRAVLASIVAGRTAVSPGGGR